MRNYKSILALILFCSTLSFGHTVTPKPPAEWSLSLKTYGVLFTNTKNFEVELNQMGKLLVTEQDANNQITKIDRNLSSKDAQEIYDQALKAFRGFRFDENYEKRYDGTNLTLRLKVYYRVLEMQFFNAPDIERENADVTKVLSLINKHLPKEHQVY